MSSKLHVLLASFAVMVTLLTIVLFVLLAFHVPYWVEIWSEMDQPLQRWQLVLVDLSASTTTYGFPITIILAGLFCLAFLWQTIAYRSHRRRTERTTP